MPSQGLAAIEAVEKSPSLQKATCVCLRQRGTRASDQKKELKCWDRKFLQVLVELERWLSG